MLHKTHDKAPDVSLASGALSCVEGRAYFLYEDRRALFVFVLVVLIIFVFVLVVLILCSQNFGYVR